VTRVKLDTSDPVRFCRIPTESGSKDHLTWVATGTQSSIFIQIKQSQNHLNFNYPYLVKIYRYTRELNGREQYYDNCYTFVHSNENDTIQFEFSRAPEHVCRYQLRLDLNDRQHVKYRHISPIMLTNKSKLEGTSEKTYRTFIVEKI